MARRRIVVVIGRARSGTAVYPQRAHICEGRIAAADYINAFDVPSAHYDWRVFDVRDELEVTTQTRKKFCVGMPRREETR